MEGTRYGSCAYSRPLFSVPGMDPEKLERIQLPVPTAAEKTTYNHLLAERLIRIMNNAAQPGARACGRFTGVVELWGPGPALAPGALASRSGPAGNPGRPQPCPCHIPLCPGPPGPLPSSCVFVSGSPPLSFPHGVCARPSLSSPSILNPALVSFACVCNPPLGVAQGHV